MQEGEAKEGEGSKDAKDVPKTDEKAAEAKPGDVIPVAGGKIELHRLPVTEGKANVTEEGGARLEVNTRQMGWEYEYGQNTFLVKNSTDNRFCFKVKVTNPELYTAAPPTSFIGAHKSITVVVIRKKGAFNNDKVIVQYAQSEESDQDSKEFWKKPGISVKSIEVAQKPKAEIDAIKKAILEAA